MDRIEANRIFLRVVESGSFSKAAVDLGIAQPTATKVVAALEQRLGARLLNRNTRGVSATEIGLLFYEKCKAIQREIEEADNLPALLQSRVVGVLRVGTSVAFGRRVLTPLLIELMDRYPELRIDLSMEDGYVNLLEQSIEVTVRMGRLADSSLGARYVGDNPWVAVASPAYLDRAPALTEPGHLVKHECMVYSTVQGDDVWHFRDATGAPLSVPVRGRMRANNLSSVLAAVRHAMGVAILPCYVARESLARGEIVPVLTAYSLPSQEIHAVYPSPKLVSTKVTTLIAFLTEKLAGEWWREKPRDPGVAAAQEAAGAT
jgi:DNA-binding transcriptional LysR family regulator